MQIVFVAPFGWQPKGTVRVRAFPLAQALVERGHSVTILIPPWDDPAAAGHKWLIDGVHVVHLDLPAGSFPLQLAGLTRTLLEAIRTIGPDVIHVFKPIGVSGAVAQAVAADRWLTTRASTRPRLVVDTDDWEGPGGWNDVSDYPPLVRLGFAAQEPLVLRAADVVTVASRELLRICTQHVGVPGPRVLYLPNSGVDRSADVSTASADAIARQLGVAGAPLVLLSTRFFELDPVVVAATWAKVVQTVPQARLIVVGDGLHGGELEFQEEIVAAGVADTVVYTGWVQPDELGALYKRASCAFLPARNTLINRARCSVKLAEVVAAGVPVVAERVGQAAEYVRDGVTGFTARPGDATRLAAAIVLLLQQPRLSAQLGDGGRRLMRESLSWHAVSAAALAAYSTAGAAPAR